MNQWSDGPVHPKPNAGALGERYAQDCRFHYPPIKLRSLTKEQICPSKVFSNA
jgi:hypothetical protein